MTVAGVLCPVGVEGAPLLWLPAYALFFPAWFALQIVSGRRGDAPKGALDEHEIEQRGSARPIELTVTHNPVMRPTAAARPR
jgi:hypothetical protein